MKKLLVTAFVLLALGNFCAAQYWFGPKVGFNRTDHNYQSETYRDSFNIQSNYNFEAGVVLTYEASRRYSVHTELIFERSGRNLENRENIPRATSKSNSGYLSIPLLLRYNLGRAPYLFYVNGGVKLSYWLFNNGRIENAFLEEGVPPFREYRLRINRGSTIESNRLALQEANRLQYALLIGVGANLDLRNKTRVMVDLRYSFGHSNQGFNGSPDFNFGDYVENFEYRNNTISLSIGYLFEYDAQLKRKGRSTNSKSNRK